MKTSSGGFAICPCCGQTTDFPDPAKLVAALPMGGVKRRMMNALLQHFGCFVNRDRLADLVYGDQLDGGPDNPGNVFSILKGQLNIQLAAVSLNIEGRFASGYRLTWLAQARAGASASTSKSDVGVCLSVPQTITD